MIIHYWNWQSLVRIASSLAIFTLLSACATIRAYQQSSPTDAECQPGSDYSGCYYRQHKDFDLAFAEFTERGNAYDTNRIDDVLHRIKEKASDPDGAITVVFIHGWLNNAANDNKNLIAFKNVLQRIADYSKTINPARRVVGTYIGWRGESIRIPLLKNLSFWNRKSVAENLGSGAVTQLLLKLDAIHQIGGDRTPSKRNVMVTVGHSFGGAILLTAVKDVLVDRLIDPVPTAGKPGPVAGIGDELFMLNPAIEALQALTLVDTALQRQYQPSQVPILTVISSDADGATHKAFPAGQAFGTLARRNQADIVRPWYKNRSNGSVVSIREENLDGITVGNFAPFLTHRLQLSNDVNPAATECSVFRVTRCSAAPELCRAKGWAKTAKHKGIGLTPPRYPLRFIKTDKNVITGHSDIFGDNVRRLLTRLITDQLVEIDEWKFDEDQFTLNSCG